MMTGKQVKLVKRWTDTMEEVAYWAHFLAGCRSGTVEEARMLVRALQVRDDLQRAIDQLVKS